MKYKSDAYEALHEETLANFKIGAISETELREFEAICFVKESKTAYRAGDSVDTSIKIMEHVTP